MESRDNEHAVDGDDDSTEFDWINSKEKIVKIHKGLSLEPQTSINVKNIYVNTDNYIEKIYKSTIQTTQPAPTGEKYTVVPYDTIIQIINAHTTAHTTAKKKYDSPKIMLFLVDLIHEHIDDFNATTTAEQYNDFHFLKEIDIYNDIRIPNSLFIFHPTNTLYIIHQEIQIDPICELVPRLKVVDEYHKPHTSRNKTKRVSFDNSIIKDKHRHRHRHRHTKKNLIIR
jgi:hypothetical protein